MAVRPAPRLAPLARPSGPPIDPRSVEVFYWVVQLGGFRRAAERLGTTQPAVSARIAALEVATGAVLLDRGQRRRVVATAAGLLLLSYAERLLAVQAEMAGAFTAAGALQGVVRLGVAETIVHTWLSTLIRRLHDAYPRLEVDIVVDVTPSLRAQLLGGEVDVALLMGPVGAPRVQDLALCAYPLAFVAPPGLALGAEPLGLADLARVPIVTYARGTRPHQRVRDLFAGTGARVFANASLASIVRLVLDGIGVGVIAPAAIPEELARGALRVLRTAVVLEPLLFTASWREGPGSEAASVVARMAQAVAADTIV